MIPRVMGRPTPAVLTTHQATHRLQPALIQGPRAAARKGPRTPRLSAYAASRTTPSHGTSLHLPPGCSGSARQASALHRYPQIGTPGSGSTPPAVISGSHAHG